ncbi:DUF3782 domain-containing protein [Infirmifilum sp. SLHALR2]|nr:MAG: hypothetical protein B7L53_00930 [Thermofilum sp. NZ13]
MLSREALKAEILRLLEEDKEFRYSVAGLLGMREVLERLDENTRAIRDLQREIKALQEQVADNTKAIKALQEQVAEHSKAIKALQEQVAEHSKAIKALQEQVSENTKAIKALQEQVAEHSKAIKALQEQVAEHSKVIAEHTVAMRELQRTISALGARWGLMSEEAFRRAMADILRSFGERVEKWVSYDEEGFVYGHPSPVEADVVVRDEEHILVEVKSSVSRGDVYELWRIARLYEKKTGVKPKLVIVTPFADPKAQQAAQKLGVRVISGTGGA